MAAVSTSLAPPAHFADASDRRGFYFRQAIQSESQLAGPPAQANPPLGEELSYFVTSGLRLQNAHLQSTGQCCFGAWQKPSFHPCELTCLMRRRCSSIN